MKTLLVYDLETSGLSPFDQVLSYAAIRLDPESLLEVDRTEIEVEWRRDMVPSPDAYLVHQIGMAGREGALLEAEAIKKIHRELNHAGTMSGGYNTLGFDDEMLRFSFYRCLLPPYTHQFRDGCGRFDILPLVVFYYLYSPESLKWPMVDGKPSFKLEAIGEENGWLAGRAHEAINDVLVTVKLMQRLKTQEDMWNYLFGFFDKQVDKERILSSEVSILVDLRQGFDRRYQVPVLYLGEHPAYKNQGLFLRLDLPIEELSSRALQPLLIRKKYGEPGFSVPYVKKYQDKLTEAVQAQVEKNRGFLSGKDWRSLIEPESFSQIENVDIDASLYQKGFWSQPESLWCSQFHAGRAIFDNIPSEHLKMQALRYLWRFHPERIPDSLVEKARASIESYLTNAIDYRNRPGLTIEAANTRINQLLEQTDNPQQKEDLEGFKKHLRQLSAAIHHTEQQ